MSINNNSALSNSPEEISTGKKSVIVEIIELECFKQDSVVTDPGWRLELNFVFKFTLESMVMI